MISSLIGSRSKSQFVQSIWTLFKKNGKISKWNVLNWTKGFLFLLFRIFILRNDCIVLSLFWHLLLEPKFSQTVKNFINSLILLQMVDYLYHGFKPDNCDHSQLSFAEDSKYFNFFDLANFSAASRSTTRGQSILLPTKTFGTWNYLFSKFVLLFGACWSGDWPN